MHVDEDTLHYSSDDDTLSAEEFTPTVMTDSSSLTSFKVRENDKAEVHLTTDKEELAIGVMRKLDLIAERISAIEQMLQSIIIISERNENLCNTSMTASDEDQSNVPIFELLVQGMNHIQRYLNASSATSVTYLFKLYTTCKKVFKIFTGCKKDKYPESDGKSPHFVSRLPIPDDVAIAIELEKAKKLRNEIK